MRVRADSTAAAGAGLRLGLREVPLPFDASLPVTRVEKLFVSTRFSDWSGAWASDVRARMDARHAKLWLTLRDRIAAAARAELAPAAAEADSQAAPVPDEDEDERPALLPDAVAEYAELGMRVTGRGEMGGAWQRFRPCTYTSFANCNPNLFPRLKPDVQFGVQVAGTISDRIHVDVDYDQRREFDAANNINVYYQGLEDEILQRLEVGDVSIQLPQSRYITQGIPSGNFGFKAAGDLGPMRFQTVWAQQKGDISTREFRLGGGGGAAQGLVQDAQAAFDDADYVKGQFFFLVDPDRLTGTPHVDVLALRASDAPASLRPTGQSLQLYRDEAAILGAQPQLGYFPAEAVSEGGVVSHSGRFRRLVAGQDYWVHPGSGLWIVLRGPLRLDEALAVAYVTESGDTVGTLNADAAPAGTRPRLRLLRGPLSKHQPGTPTWKYEMHQVYRLDASNGVDPSSIKLRVSLGDVARGVTYRTVEGQQVSWLRFFGMDEDSPTDQIDQAQVFQPGATGLGGDFATSGGVGGTYLVFPTLRPFATPPPVPSAGLTAEQTRAALAADSNAVIYENPDPVLRDGGARFRLSVDYRVKMEGMVSSFNLGALGIREGSERILVDGRALERGTDYSIDYDLGMVTLADAQSVYGTNPDAEIRATWEQQALFQIAPTSVFGLNAGFKLGTVGEVNFLGMYQAEKSVLTRPQLGVEPGSILLGGVSGKLGVGAGWLDRALDQVPGLRLGATSSVDLNGEVALSMPTPNLRGDTYLDDFESTDEQSLRLDRRSWRLGSRPQSNQGDGGVLPPALTVANAGQLVWQHDYLIDRQVVAGVPVGLIDRQVQITRADVPSEQQMLLSFGTPRGAPQDATVWRSMTTVLSTTGQDLSRSEFLELYVASADAQRLSLVLDLGVVSEDAFFVDSLGRTRGTTREGRAWGLDVLDEEARQSEREIWGAYADERGLWDQGCSSTPGTTYAIADPLSNCLRNNGINDTEDLDGNGSLDPDDGAYFRYVLDLGPQGRERFMVRDTGRVDMGGTGTDYRLYRIPLRDLGVAEPVNNASAATWRFIKHLRVTVAGRPGELRGGPALKIARMRIVGSRWTKRGQSGIVAGLAGDTAGLPALADFRVGPVSRLNDFRYTSPPGVVAQAQDATSGFTAQGEEINEKSLRLAYDALPAGHRAEVYYRYLQQPRSLMTYRDLRLWAVPVAGRWGPAGDQRLLVKVATDAHNYYLFQTRLSPAAAGDFVTKADWTQAVVDFNRWFDLKAEAERLLIEQGPPPAGQRMELWSADSAYAIVLEDRARAPNLAAVREVSFAVFNGDGAPADGEVWIDELRLGAPMTDPGMASNVRLDVRGGDFVSASVAYANQGALFQQLNQDASYQSQGELSLSTRAELGQFAPSSWGLAMPVEVLHARTGSDPSFLDRSDVRAERLEGLRESGGDQTRVGVSLRKRTPTANPWLSLLVDGTALSLNYSAASSSTVTSRARTSGVSGGLTYSRQVSARDLDVTPGWIDAALRALFPAALETTELFQRLAGARLRWSPESVGFGSVYNRSDSRSFNYDRILELPSDTVVRPIESPRQGLENNATLALRPFESVRASLTLTSSRNLLEPERASTREAEREAMAGARDALAGLDLGWESNRTLGAQLDWKPLVSRWLMPSFSFGSRFRTDRNPSYFEVVAAESGDSTAMMQRAFQADRQITRALQLDPAALVESTLGAVDSTATWAESMVRRLGGALQRIDLSWNEALGSQYERELDAPGLGYQFGLGGIDRFRHLGGDTAMVAQVRDAFRARGGLRVAGADLFVGFSESRSDVLDLRGGARVTSEKRWPETRLNWGNIPVPGPLKHVVLRAGASAGMDRIRRSSVLGGDVGAQGRGSVETNVPVQLNLILRTGLNLTYSGALASGTAQDPTGDSEMERASHTVQLVSSFSMPKSMRTRFPNPVQASLRYSYSAQSECRVRPVAEGQDAQSLGCVAFTDALTRGLNFSLDTNMSDLTVGLQASYNDSQRFIGTRDGSSQFQLGLFGQFNFEAGRFPTPGGFR